MGNGFHSGSFEIFRDAKIWHPDAMTGATIAEQLMFMLFHMKGMSQCELLGLLFSRIIWYDKILMQPKRLLYPMKCRRHGCDWCRISPLAQVYTLVSGCQSQDKQPQFCMSKFSFLCPISCRQLPQYPHTFVFLNSKWKWKRFSTLKKSYLGRIGEHIWIIWRKCGINR